MDWGGNVIKFDLKRFVNEEIAINCETKEQARDLYNILKSKCKLYDDERTNVEKWNYNKEKTCFRIERDVVYYYMFFSEKDTYSNKNFKIVKFKDLIFDKGVGNMKTFEQFAKSNGLSGLVAKSKNGYKGLIVKLAGKNYILQSGGFLKPVITKIGDEEKLYKPIKNIGDLDDILSDSNLKLVWEKQHNIDWSKVPVDTKVLCKFGDCWHKRYFAGVHYEGSPLAFCDGQNSWSANGCELISSISSFVLFEGNEHLLKGGK